ncbi:MAG: NUDIX hydrolase [Cyclobacteriaceae bacterium]|nr:NUDIX hydrolase [Cyclobacteriaceae bacterium HetDA_MAG_MS6]
MTEKIVDTQVTLQSYECTMTVDCAIFGFQAKQLQLLLVQRAIDPFKNQWMLPGGIVQHDQSLEEATDHVLFTLTGLSGIHQEQVKVYSSVDRHPVKRVITTCFYALIKPENHPVIAKNYISEVRWFAIQNLPELGFDHMNLVSDAREQLRHDMQQRVIFGELLPTKFTLTELQDLYESVLEEKLDRRNFRKKILQSPNLIKTKEKKAGAKGGPDLYKLK